MKPPLSQIISTAIVITIGVATLHSYTSYAATFIVAILFGAFARFSDRRKFPIYASAIVAGGCLAGTGIWVMKGPTGFENARLSVEMLLAAFPIAVLAALVIGYYGRKVF
ncbi:MAG: hypothetical protein Q7T18_04690 [Sedimentisphaerales bacterium]|nr:hypothetical protein [Sedimentisphaerales bacterium]